MNLRVLRVVVPVVGLAVGLALLHWLVDLPAVFRRLADADPAWILVAVALNSLAPVVVAVKVQAYVRLAGETVTFRRAWSAVMAAVALNAVLPARGGDLIRAVFLAENRGTVSLLVGVVVLERLVDVFTLGLLSLVAALFGGVTVATALATGACLAAVAAILVMASGHRLPWKTELAERVGRAARRVPAHPGPMLLGFACSLVSWGLNIVLMGALLRAVGVVASPAAVARATPVAILAGILPVTLGGIGTRDTTFVLLLGDGTNGDRIAAAAFLYTAITLWLQGLLGSAALGRETLRRTRRAAEDARSGA